MSHRVHAGLTPPDQTCTALAKAGLRWSEAEQVHENLSVMGISLIPTAELERLRLARDVADTSIAYMDNQDEGKHYGLQVEMNEAEDAYRAAKAKEGT